MREGTRRRPPARDRTPGGAPLAASVVLALAVGACGGPDEAAVEGGAGLPNGAAEEMPGPYRLGDVAWRGDTVLVRHDDDLWVVGGEGGVAVRLLPPGAVDQDGEALPLPRYAPTFSPEGGRLAFSAGSDAYVLDRGDGSIRRLTYHPRGDRVRGWTPAGDSVLFASFRRKSGNNFQLHAIPAEGGVPVQLPLPFAFDAALSPDGTRLVAQLFGPARLTDWIGYRGGLARALYLVDRESWTVADSVPHGSRQDVLPMWWGEHLYFASARGVGAAGPSPAGDRGDGRDGSGGADPSAGRAAESEDGRVLPGGFDLYRWRPGDGRPERLTAFRYGGIDAASAGPDGLVLSAEGRVYLYEPPDGRLTAVPLRFPEEELAPLDSVRVPVAGWARTPAFGAGAEALAAEVRGDIVAWDRGTGHLRFLTRTPGSREHGPALSPDGERVAYWSDASGEERLRVAPVTGGPATAASPDDRGAAASPRAAEISPAAGGGAAAAVREIVVEEDPTRYGELAWSPDGRWLAFRGERLGLWVADVGTGSVRRIAASDFPGQGSWEHVFSPDGRSLAYSRADARGVRGVFLHDLEADRAARVSDPLAHASHPAFDPSGRHLYFATGERKPLAIARDIPFWGLLSTDWSLPLLSARLQVAVLDPRDRAPVLPTGQPAPVSGLPDAAGPGPEGAGRAAGDLLEGIAARVVPLPPDRRDVLELDALAPGVLLLRAVAWPEAPAEANAPPTPVYVWRRSEPGRLERLLEDADEVVAAPGGGAFLYRRGDDWRSARPGPPLREEGLDWGGDSVTVKRLPEWRQMYREVWRRVRTTYVGPEREALDLDALQAHYAGHLPHLRDRAALDALFREMLGHLDLVSHLSAFGGAEWPRPGAPAAPPDPPAAGLLGADLVPDGGRYRLERVFRSNRWSALLREVSAPLDAPGVAVREGEYLLAVDGRPATAEGNPFAHLAGTAGRATELTVGPRADGTGARTVTVFPVGDDRPLRESTWAVENRRRVEEATDGRVGYVWIKAFSGDLIRNMVGALAALQDREALIVDVRFNGGGTTADALIEILRREPIYAYDYRHGDDLRIPPVLTPGPKVLIASQHNASAAETFILMWKAAGLGPVIGTPTVGALVGASLDQPPLADGGRVLLPNRASHAPGLPPSRLEGVGLAPDRYVDWTPADWQAGRRPQLEAAIEEALRSLER